MECSKCHESLYKCKYCDGQTKSGLLGGHLTCKTCNSTGWLCPRHEGYWE
jgi:hypothetical protein